jgi:hypothetical protein
LQLLLTRTQVERRDVAGCGLGNASKVGMEETRPLQKWIEIPADTAVCPGSLRSKCLPEWETLQQRGALRDTKGEDGDKGD